MNGMNAQSPVVERESRREVRAAGVGSCDNESARSQRELTPGHDHSPAKDK